MIKMTTISWSYHGYIMVISWSYYGHIMVISWSYNGMQGNHGEACCEELYFLTFNGKVPIVANCDGDDGDDCRKL